MCGWACFFTRSLTLTLKYNPSHPGSFDLLIYTHPDATVPDAWGDSAERTLHNAADVALRSFSTRVHKVAAQVSYRRMSDSDDD